MKTLITLFTLLIGLTGFSQVQNSKLAENLLLSVQSGANALPGTAITSGTPTSGVTYVMGHVGASSDFSASGAPATANGVTFKADGDAPGAWDGAILRPINSTALCLPDPSYSMANSGAIPTYGHLGNSSYLAFDGVDDFAPATIPAVGTGDYSVLIRIKRNGNPAANGYILGADGTGTATMWDVYMNTSGNLVARVGSGVSVTNTTVVTDNAFHSCIFTADRDGNGVWYVDGGSAEGTTSISVNVSNNLSETTLLIGKRSDGYPTDVAINSVMLWNYVVNTDTVAYYSNPTNHLKASDNDGSGNENTLCITAESFVSPTLIRDWYHNTDIALSGATAPRLVKSWGGEGWRMDGATSVLTKSSASDGLTGDITIAGYLFATGWGESNLGRIFDNGKVILTVKSDSTLSFTRDGSTTIYSGKNLSLNTWYNYVVTSTSAGVTNLYINGALSGTANQAGGTPASGTTYYFGSNNGANTFSGVLQMPRIYKKIFSTEDIALEYLIFQYGGL